MKAPLTLKTPLLHEYQEIEKSKDEPSDQTVHANGYLLRHDQKK